MANVIQGHGVWYQWKTHGSEIPRVGLTCGQVDSDRAGSGQDCCKLWRVDRVWSKIIEIYFCWSAGKIVRFKIVHVNSPLQCPIYNVLFCCSCIPLVHVMFTRLYIFKYIYLTTWKILILVIIISFSGRFGSGRVTIACD